MPHVIERKDHPHYLTKYEGKGTKISIFKIFNELGKIWKCDLSFSKIPISHLFMNWEKYGNIHSPIPTFQNPNVEFMDELENLCPYLTFLAENKMGIHIKEDGHISNLT